MPCRFEDKVLGRFRAAKSPMPQNYGGLPIGEPVLRVICITLLLTETIRGEEKSMSPSNRTY